MRGGLNFIFNIDDMGLRFGLCSQYSKTTSDLIADTLPSI